MYNISILESSATENTVKHTVTITTDAGEDPDIFVVMERGDESGSFVEKTEFHAVASPADMHQYGSTKVYDTFYRVATISFYSYEGNSDLLEDTLEALADDIQELVTNCSLATLVLNVEEENYYFDSGSYENSGSFVFREKP